MSYQKVCLGDLATFVNGYPFKPADWGKKGREIIRIQNLTHSSKERNFFDGELSEKYKVSKDDILISWSATLDIFIWNGEDGWLNQHIFKVVFNKENLDKTFFFYLIKFVLEDIKRQVHGATMQHITKERFDNLKVPFPSFSIQKKIADILDKADSLRQTANQLIEHYNQLTQSIFYKMFGDPVSNKKRWEVHSLSKFGTLKNGLNYRKDEKGFGVLCLGVGDFQSHWQISNVAHLSKTNLSKMPSGDFFLKDGDLVFVRSNGNKNLIGRCVAVYPEFERVTFSGFCIRYRATEKGIDTTYIAHLFRIPSFRKAMLQNGRGANIQNINQQLLESLNIPCPPIELQKQFSTIVEKIEILKMKCQRGLLDSENLFTSLSQRAFKGELVNEG